MQATIRNIGNSKGIILPKSILAQCHIESEVSIEVKNDQIVIAAAKMPGKKRKGWEKAFQEMAAAGDDVMALPDVFDDEHNAEWAWK